MARNQKTDGIDMDAEGLPDLTPRQLKFVEGLRQGLTASDAYRAAYDTSNSTPNTVWCEASKLKTHPKVSQWISYLQRETITAQNYTHEQFLAELEELRQLSVASGNMGAAVNATVNKGKSAGHMVEKAEITINQEAELEVALETLARAGINTDAVKH